MRIGGDFVRFEQLQYVQAVAQCGSMNTASVRLHVSQQAVSKAIRQLENELGVAIFVRTNKGAVLTPQGKALCDFIERQGAKMDELKRVLLAEQRRLMTGELTLATMNTGANMILPQMLCEFYRSYPNVRLSIVDGMVDEVIARVLSGQAQLGMITFARLGAASYPLLPEALAFVPLLEGTTFYWVSKRSNLAGRQTLTFEEVAAQPVLFYEMMEHAFLKETYAYFGYQPQVALQSKNLYLLGQLTAENYGILPDMRLNQDEGMYQYVFNQQPAAVAIPLKDYPDYRVYVGYIIRRDHPKSLLLGHVLDFLARIGQKTAAREAGEA